MAELTSVEWGIVGAAVAVAVSLIAVAGYFAAKHYGLFDSKKPTAGKFVSSVMQKKHKLPGAKAAESVKAVETDLTPAQGGTVREKPTSILDAQARQRANSVLYPKPAALPKSIDFHAKNVIQASLQERADMNKQVDAMPAEDSIPLDLVEARRVNTLKLSDQQFAPGMMGQDPKIMSIGATNAHGKPAVMLVNRVQTGNGIMGVAEEAPSSAAAIFDGADYGATPLSKDIDYQGYSNETKHRAVRERVTATSSPRRLSSVRK